MGYVALLRKSTLCCFVNVLLLTMAFNLEVLWIGHLFWLRPAVLMGIVSVQAIMMCVSPPVIIYDKEMGLRNVSVVVKAIEELWLMTVLVMVDGHGQNSKLKGVHWYRYLSVTNIIS